MILHFAACNEKGDNFDNMSHLWYYCTYLLHNLCVCFVYLLQPISSEDLYVGEKKQRNGYSVILKRNKNFVYKQCKRLFNRKCHTILTINFFLFLWPLWHESFLYILFNNLYFWCTLVRRELFFPYFLEHKQ